MIEIVSEPRVLHLRMQPKNQRNWLQKMAHIWKMTGMAPLEVKLWLVLHGVMPIGGGSKGNTFENDLMKLIFQATAIANIADNAASAPLTNLYMALHTADPGEAGVQNTSESAYTNYARVAVARTSGGWTVTNNSASNAAVISFPQSGSGPETETFGSVGVASSGATKLLYSGALTANLVVNNLITPSFAIGDAVFSED
jgi:hypothetical protein